MATIKERSAEIQSIDTSKISKKLPVFYNPIMVHNRDISVLVLLSLRRRGLQICDLLAGSGIRSLRLLKELPKPMIKSITINDHSKGFRGRFQSLLKANDLSGKKVEVFEEDANLLLQNSTGFDYIDIDPFGTPNPFLDMSIRRLSREGILAVTATDTSSLAGTYPRVCMRNYWAQPMHNFLMHEAGIRILIRKIQLIGSQYEKALTPILAYSKDHYYRVFLHCEKSKSKCNENLSKHKFIDSGLFPLVQTEHSYGPCWSGQLQCHDTAKNAYKMSLKLFSDPSLHKFLEKLYFESKVTGFGFYCIHELTRMWKLGSPPKMPMVIDAIKRKKFKAAPTHFSPTGIRTDAPLNVVKSIMLHLTK